MCRTFAPLLLALAALCLAFAPAPLPRAKRTSTNGLAPSIEGRWLIEGPRLLEISATNWTLDPDRAPGPSYRLSTDRAAYPPTFDLFGVHTGGDGQPQWLGIYKIEGDTLTICYNRAENGRPITFDGPDMGRFTQTFRRAR
jgi:uncharacterized protein (TIGR03067 family)